MVFFDSAMLTLLVRDQAGPIDPATGKPVERCQERMELLVQEPNKSKQIILIPTPVISEVLPVSGPSGLRYLAIWQKSPVFRIEPLDTRAAIELAEMNRVHLVAGDKKAGIDAPWQKIKIDRQIVSIAKVAGAKTLYTNDGPLKKTAEAVGLKVIGVHELPLPAKQDQIDLLELLEREVAAMNEVDAKAPQEDEPEGPDSQNDTPSS